MLDQLGFSECLVGTVLGNCSKAFGGNFYSDSLIKFCDIHSLLLEIWCSFSFPRRVELGRTSAVTVLAPDLGLLAGDVALLCHKVVFSGAILPCVCGFASVSCQPAADKFSLGGRIMSKRLPKQNLVVAQLLVILLNKYGTIEALWNPPKSE